MPDCWDLTAISSHRFCQHDYEVAVLPVGATEVHNRHLPIGTDVRHTTIIAHRSCQAAWENCQSVICLPTLPYGVDCNLLAFPLTIHVSQATLDAMVREIITSVRLHGIRKVVIVNGHGGNEFMPLIRQIQYDTDVHVFLCNWWQVGRDRYKDIFEAPDDHGGEMETSVALSLFPDLVEPDTARSGKARPFRLEALREGWVRTSRNFARLNDHCAVGDPSKAAAEKGEQYLDLVIGRIGEFLVELAETPIDEHFPHTSEAPDA